ncbi:hypothetical protein AMK22_12450 [Streptomyces sp. CB01580]|nr:hypothetical protein AMK22_12450 [Streptomyces sp. CB01580]
MRVRPGCVGQVEEIAAACVAEGDELVTGGFDGGGKSGEAAPGSEVCGGCGPVGGEAAAHQLLPDRIAVIGGERVDVPSEPGGQGQIAYAGRLVPQAARWELGAG